jgi:hypothetical protein
LLFLTKDGFTMNGQLSTNFFGRIGSLFRKPGLDGVIRRSLPAPDGGSGPGEPGESGEQRAAFLRPWSRRDQAIDQVQNGVAALTDLIGTIRETLDRQSDRQDELMQCLALLPKALDALPESNRVHGEALRVIQTGIEQQNAQQGKLATVLERMSRDDTGHARVLDSVREKIDMIGMHEEAISHSLTSVSKALASVSTNSESSSRVLENLKANIGTRDGELERIIRKQNTRFTTMLTVAIVLSMAALTAVVVLGYLGYESLSRMH